MFNDIKTKMRDFLPKNIQVPSKYWYGWLRGSLEKEMQLLKFIVPSGGLAIDIGGNRGVYTYQLWRGGAVVEVFEPNPICMDVLDSWASNKKSVHLHSVALSNSTGSANLHIPVDELGVEHDASASIEHESFKNTRDQLVSLDRLDHFSFKHVVFIKIDVEGHELSVIEGAQSTIVSSTPALLVEIEQRHNDKPINEVFERILGFGYKGFFMASGKLISLENFDFNRDQAIDSFDNQSDSYINNFLFLHQEKLNSGEYSALVSGYME